MRTFFKNALTVFGSVLFTLLLIEVALRFLPVNEGLWAQPINEAAPVMHFAPNRTSTWSRFADFSMVNTVHSNNYGFLNDQDYDPQASLPLIAFIGDSYVEAVMVPYAQTVHGRLAQELDGLWRVYSFGVSGAPLSQYLAMARFVRDEFGPERLYIIVIGNDFDESLLKYKDSPGHHYFEENGESLRLVRKDYSPSLPIRTARNLRLVMYLMTNVQITHTLSTLTAPAVRLQGNTDASTDYERIKDSIRATDAFLDMLPQAAGLDPGNICLIVDAVRPEVYTAETPSDGYFTRMREHLLVSARAMGFQTIDLHPVFRREYLQDGLPFEYPRDGHWSGHGHAACARAILEHGIAPPAP
ncbi:hypothetical protein GKC30_09345 [Pseudodesulfovibrio sp. F-1]|uniref:AlgX/AlgJ SGNH hydrolase-like domain-containing protein n=1 Tax=Pseudodesulfovibrio alkaliphilus TaxID=2661613 RepID=A0A7K1KP26_9BACT|nr:SGNH/GDSL hydrolase family protein [Pseudodesulfovibrio alkaliphilus]MUM77838.1 hypothetical protein [Pseudodesulfovibrio alkaliphilus]